MSDGMTTHDLQMLLDRFRAGDSTAKGEMVTRAYGRMLLICHRMLNDYQPVREDKETTDIAHETYQRLERALDENRPASAKEFFGFVTLQARRVLLDSVRNRNGRGKQRRSRNISLSAGGAADGDSVPAIDPADSYLPPEEGAMVGELLEAVEKLPVEEREVVDLLFFHGLTQPEASEILGVHKDTVKRRWSSARIKLANWLDDGE